MSLGHADITIKANGRADPQSFELQDGTTGAAYVFDGGTTWFIEYGNRRPNGTLEVLGTITDIDHSIVTDDDGTTWNHFDINPDPDDMLALDAKTYQFDCIRVEPSVDSPAPGTNDFDGTLTIIRGVSI